MFIFFIVAYITGIIPIGKPHRRLQMDLDKKDRFDISIVSDPHVLAYDLIADTEDFNKEIMVDRKLLVESEELLSEALNMVDRVSSKYLFLPGDMVKDGEYKSHQVVAKKLKEWQERGQARELFITPGNHDINVHKSYDFKKAEPTKNTSPREFYELYSFIFENPYVKEFYKDSPIFKNYLDRVNKEYEREDEYSYYAHGYFSYVTRIPISDGEDSDLTLICLDTSIYSADNEQSHRDGRENVPGSVTLEQMKWTVDKIEEAKKRKDMIFVMAHHAIMPNYRNQELVLSPFIIKEWRTKFNDSDPRINGKTPIEVLADNGVKFVFTGHLHENGTAKFVSELGNTIYDVQTGSTVTYPLPIRHIRLVDKLDEAGGFEVFIKTELIKKLSYTNLDNEIVVVDDAIQYTINKQLSLKDVTHNYSRIQANNPRFHEMDIKKEVAKLAYNKAGIKIPAHGYMNELVFPEIQDFFPIKRKYIGTINAISTNGDYEFIIKAFRNTIHIKADNIEEAIDVIIKQIEDEILNPYVLIKYWDMIVNKAWQMPIGNEGHTFYDFANYIYQYKPLGEEERPSYVNKMMENLANPSYDIINIVLDYNADEINYVFDKLASSIKLEKDGSKDKFFDDLIQTEGFASGLAYNYLKRRVYTLRDLLDFFSRFITKKKDLKGVDIAKVLVKSVYFKNAKENISNEMFGQNSLRRFVIELVNAMSDEMVEIYQNEDLNELEEYFNYIEYVDYKEA